MFALDVDKDWSATRAKLLLTGDKLSNTDSENKCNTDGLAGPGACGAAAVAVSGGGGGVSRAVGLRGIGAVPLQAGQRVPAGITDALLCLSTLPFAFKPPAAWPTDNVAYVAGNLLIAEDTSDHHNNVLCE